MKKSQCPPVFKTIRNKNQKTKNTTALEKTWIVDAYHYENNQQQKLKEKNKQAEKPIKKSISSFLDLLKNYYHYFVQPEPEKSIMLVYNYIYIQKTELSKQNKNILLLHTRENYAYNDHDLVTRPLPMNFECRNNSNLEFSNIEMFINRNPFLSWHVYSSIDHYIKLHHYHIKN